MGDFEANVIGDGTDTDREGLGTVSDAPALAEGAITEAERDRMEKGIDREGEAGGELVANEEGGRRTTIEQGINSNVIVSK